MHNSFILQQYVCYTTILNMFRAARCSSSRGQIVSPQPLVSSISVNSRTVCRFRADCSPLSTCILYGCLQRLTIPEAVVIQFVLLRMTSVLQSDLNLHTVRLFTEVDDTRGCGDTICPPEDEQRAARNMLRIVVLHTYCWRIKELCIKFVIWKSILWCTVRKTSASECYINMLCYCH